MKKEGRGPTTSCYFLVYAAEDHRQDSTRSQAKSKMAGSAWAKRPEMREMEMQPQAKNQRAYYGVYRTILKLPLLRSFAGLDMYL